MEKTVHEKKAWTRPKFDRLGAMRDVAGGGRSLEGKGSKSAAGPS